MIAARAWPAAISLAKNPDELLTLDANSAQLSPKYPSWTQGLIPPGGGLILFAGFRASSSYCILLRRNSAAAGPRTAMILRSIFLPFSLVDQLKRLPAQPWTWPEPYGLHIRAAM